MSAISGIDGNAAIPKQMAPLDGKPADLPLWQAAQDFEAIFLAQFVRTMRSSEFKGGLLEEAAGHSTFDAMFSEAIGREMAGQNALGLTRHIYRKLGGRYCESTPDTTKSNSLENNSATKPEKNDAP